MIDFTNCAINKFKYYVRKKEKKCIQKKKKNNLKT